MTDVKHAQGNSWSPAVRLINAALRDSRKLETHLESLLQKSGRRFPGLDEPLRVVFNDNRWLDDEREESYSDWLGWIVQRLCKPNLVLPLFGLKPARLPSKQMSASREESTRFGRLDLVIRYGEQATLLVEVKTVSKPGGEQLSRYAAYLRTQPRRLALVLLAADPLTEKGPQHQFCSWSDLCLRLRSHAEKWCLEVRRLEAAMALGFCGAVEQNVLKLGVRGIQAPRLSISNSGYTEALLVGRLDRSGTLLLRCRGMSKAPVSALLSVFQVRSSCIFLVR
jgi:hypothetical protein